MAPDHYQAKAVWIFEMVPWQFQRLETGKIADLSKIRKFNSRFGHRIVDWT
jgi:hypothetical protein